jgi:hypothetical protein
MYSTRVPTPPPPQPKLAKNPGSKCAGWLEGQKPAVFHTCTNLEQLTGESGENPLVATPPLHVESGGNLGPPPTPPTCRYIRHAGAAGENASKRVRLICHVPMVCLLYTNRELFFA